MNSLQGQLLVAAPELLDPNFARSVVLIVRHGVEGAFGLILNRPTNTSLKEIWPHVSSTPCQNTEILHVGGPVAGPLVAIHTRAALSQTAILPGIFLSVETGALGQLAAEEEPIARFFVGHAGWGPGQLDHELEVGGWLTRPATSEHIFGKVDELWEKVVKEIASPMALSPLKIKHVPEDPSLN